MTLKHCHPGGQTTKWIGLRLAALVLVLTSTAAADGVRRDPLSVVRALMDAESAANLEGAMALFAEDAYIINVTGRKTASQQELRWFINSDIWLRDNFTLDHLHLEGDAVVWDEPAGEEFYKNIGVAPVQFIFEAVVRDTKITSIVAHLPAGEIARIKRGCDAQAVEPRIHGCPCSEFVQLIGMHTAWHELTRASAGVHL